MFQQIESCRICGNRDLVPILDLGEQTLTGVFPRSASEQITRGRLQLLKCHGEGACGLVQLRHSYDSGEMYGANYGYRSSLNRSMVQHLGAGPHIDILQQIRPIQDGRFDPGGFGSHRLIFDGINDAIARMRRYEVIHGRHPY